MKLISEINNSGIFAQSAISASVSTKDSLGRDITATYLTAHQTIPSAKWEDTSDVVQNNSAKWNEIEVYETNSASYLTAHQDISNKLDTTAFSTVSGTFLTAHQDLSNYATTSDLDTASSFISGAVDYVSANAGSTYSGIDPIIVDNENKIISANTTPLTVGSGLQYDNGELSVSGLEISGINLSVYEQDNKIVLSAGATFTQAQANWDELDSSSPSYIQNKPTIPQSPVQSNWTENDSWSLAYIQNKPTTMNLMAGPGIGLYENDNNYYISASTSSVSDLANYFVQISGASAYSAYTSVPGKIYESFDIENVDPMGNWSIVSGNCTGDLNWTSMTASWNEGGTTGSLGISSENGISLVEEHTTSEDTGTWTFGPVNIQDPGETYNMVVMLGAEHSLVTTSCSIDVEMDSVVTGGVLAPLAFENQIESTSSLLNNQITAVRNDLNTVSTNTGYLYNDIQTTSGILSGAIDYVSSNAGLYTSPSGTSIIDNINHTIEQTNSAIGTISVPTWRARWSLDVSTVPSVGVSFTPNTVQLKFTSPNNITGEIRLSNTFEFDGYIAGKFFENTDEVIINIPESWLNNLVYFYYNGEVPSNNTITGYTLDGTPTVTSGVRELAWKDDLSSYMNTSLLGLSGSTITSYNGSSFADQGGNYYPMTGNPSGFMTNMFLAHYGTSTYQEVKSAVDNGKIVYCQISPTGASRMAFLAYIGSNNYEFQYYRSLNQHTSSNQGDEVYVYTCNRTGTTWTTTTRNCYTRISATSGLDVSYSNGTYYISNPHTATPNIVYQTSSISIPSGVWESGETFNTNLFVGAGKKFTGTLMLKVLACNSPNFSVDTPGHNYFIDNGGDYVARRINHHLWPIYVDNTNGSTPYEVWFKLYGDFPGGTTDTYLEGIEM